jgi:hypothetical protein
MSEELKAIYQEAGLLQYHFDQLVPRDLFRGQSRTEEKGGYPVLYPNPGFIRPDKSVRLADVKIVERNGQQIVKGCRCIRGDYRGVSTFDRKNPVLRGFKWYKLSQGAEILEALAITQDSDYKYRPNHFTIAPKDDMPLTLFQVWLNALTAQMSLDE